MHQTTGDILSVGLELFVDESVANNHMKLIQYSSNRLDLKIYSVNQNDSGLYTCMFNDDKLSSFLLEIFSKYLQNRLNKLSVIRLSSLNKKEERENCIFFVKYTLERRR